MVRLDIKYLHIFYTYNKKKINKRIEENISVIERKIRLHHKIYTKWRHLKYDRLLSLKYYENIR